MELALQFAFKITEKVLEPAYHWEEFGGLKLPFIWFLKNLLVTEERNILLLFPKSTYYSVNKRREYLSTEGVFVKQH